MTDSKHNVENDSNRKQFSASGTRYYGECAAETFSLNPQTTPWSKYSRTPVLQVEKLRLRVVNHLHKVIWRLSVRWNKSRVLDHSSVLLRPWWAFKMAKGLEMSRTDGL